MIFLFGYFPMVTAFFYMLHKKTLNKLLTYSSSKSIVIIQTKTQHDLKGEKKMKKYFVKANGYNCVNDAEFEIVEF